MAEGNGDPAGYLARLSREWGIPLVLYTTLTPNSAAMLLRLAGSGWGIRYVIFRRYDDQPSRFLKVVANVERDGGPPLAGCLAPAHVAAPQNAGAVP